MRSPKCLARIFRNHMSLESLRILHSPPEPMSARFASDSLSSQVLPKTPEFRNEVTKAGYESRSGSYQRALTTQTPSAQQRCNKAESEQCGAVSFGHCFDIRPWGVDTGLLSAAMEYCFSSHFLFAIRRTLAPGYDESANCGQSQLRRFWGHGKGEIVGRTTIFV